MARIAGVDLPRDKNIWIALTYIYGIGRSLSKKILEEAGIAPNIKVRDLQDEEVARLNNIIETRYKVEGDLRREISANLRRLMETGCYRGLRHKVGLPVRGQRTRTNARTRKGPRARIGAKR